MKVRRRIDVSGMVQGVGFRPFVYRLATRHGLTGKVMNTTLGVTIEVQGPQSAIQEFEKNLPAERPPLSMITTLASAPLPCAEESAFRIVASANSAAVRTLISPDIATCDDCLREMLDPGDRRYRYAFTNCTNCGPRFTIIRSLPYDRPGTSMAGFTMCAKCQAEYDDPLDRRFHAQPNACPECGPRLELVDAGGTSTAGDPLEKAIDLLKAGAVMAIKGLGGFHLVVDAMNTDAVSELRRRKRRVEKPFAVMVPDVATAETLAVFDRVAREALVSRSRPIVLAEKRHENSFGDSVAPRNRRLGLFLPYTPLHHLLFQIGKFTALVMTSANLSEEPIVIGNEEALRRLPEIADCFLMHDREILLRCDDSVVRSAGGSLQFVRRSRGFVPAPVFLRDPAPPVLAVGGELKNTICLTKENCAFLSQHIGDLENAEANGFFAEATGHLQKIIKVTPAAIAHDLHPDYFSTRWAQQQTAVPCIGVQHHHAHVASCMAENRIDGPVIGLVLDGTGYGTDGRMWGGEILVADFNDFERAGQLRYVRMPGGEAAVRQPWRMAASYLWQHFGDEFLRTCALFPELPENRMEPLLQMLRRGLNSPWTSGCGRLFDAVSALIGICRKINYEAQAAIELEACVETHGLCLPYAFEIREEEGRLVIDTKPMFLSLMADLRRGVSRGEMSRKFHMGLAVVFTEAILRVRQEHGLNRVCLSGGSFQNAVLLREMRTRLSEQEFEVFTHSQVPAGDGGLCLGQAAIAASRLRGKMS